MAGISMHPTWLQRLMTKSLFCTVSPASMRSFRWESCFPYFPILIPAATKVQAVQVFW